LRSRKKKKEKEIAKNPRSGVKTEFEGILKIKILKYYSLFYRINNKTIEIVAFWDNRRNPDNLEL
jgi:plasmid stabilization system protein ParE